ncbi:MAG TPA: hypothetical protein VHK91_12830, partial [Flavisolibacter sp.]|nr:hypothetical protein [Flavisolibacter sp.]
MNTLHTKSTRIILSVAGLSLFVLALIWISYFRQTSFDRKEAIRLGIEKNSNLAVALEQYAISTLRHADAILQLVRLEYAREGSGVDLPKVLAAAHVNGGIIADVTLLDRQGRLVASNISLPKGMSPEFSDRSYFQFHLQHPQDSLYISKPLVSRIIGKTVLSISRRLTDAQGRFDGVVALQIEPSTFTSFYAEARL